MLKPHFADRRTLTGDLDLIKGFTLDVVAHRKAAIGTVIGAEIGKIEWHVKTDRIAESLAGQLLCTLCHGFQISAGGGGEQCHHVFAGGMARMQRTLDICRFFAVNPQADLIPIELPPAFHKGAHEYASRNPVSGLLACA
ncbi:hypothetical protein D3C80_1061390 [compost metagenome]